MTGGTASPAPPRRRAAAPAAGDSAGFALLIVLWALVLIAFIVAHLTSTGRTEVRIAANLADNARAQAAADGAVFQAIFNLSDPQPETRWPLDGSTRQIRIGDSRIVVRLDDEDARINPNNASPDLLEALLETAGSDPDTAVRLTDAIEEWVGNANSGAATENAIDAEYKAAGLSYTPPEEPLETLGELGQVLGMTPHVLAAIRPHLSLYADSGPDPAYADPVVAAAIALAARRSAQVATPPASPAQASTKLTARIIATANGPGNARVRTVAVVRIDTGDTNGYQILARNGAAD